MTTHKEATKFKVGDIVRVHGSLPARVESVKPDDVYLVEYTDGIGADFMHAKCLTLIEGEEDE